MPQKCNPTYLPTPALQCCLYYKTSLIHLASSYAINDPVISRFYSLYLPYMLHPLCSNNPISPTLLDLLINQPPNNIKLTPSQILTQIQFSQPPPSTSIILTLIVVSIAVSTITMYDLDMARTRILPIKLKYQILYDSELLAVLKYLGIIADIKIAAHHHYAPNTPPQNGS